MTPSIAQVVFSVFKILSIIGMVLYSIFAVIMVRQEQLMAKVLEESFEPILRTLVLIHFIVAIGVLLFAVILL